MARKPRYLELAVALKKKISGGKIKIGDLLPTEYELCEKFEISRHTARAALQVLEDEGLIERKPGLGTKVISKGDATTFSQPLGGLSDLMQYAHEAQLQTNSTERVALTPASAKRLGAPRGSKWLVIHGLRMANDAPIAATTLYISDVIDAKPSHFKDASRAITEHIEKRFGVRVASITQTIKAATLSADDASSLKAKTGQPALWTIRRYFDAAERLFVLSDTRHPADRFEYEMTYKRRSTTK